MKTATSLILNLVAVGVALCPLVAAGHGMTPAAGAFGGEHQHLGGSVDTQLSVAKGAVHAAAPCCHEDAAAAVLSSGVAPATLIPSVAEVSAWRAPEMTAAQPLRTVPTEGPPALTSPLRC